MGLHLRLTPRGHGGFGHTHNLGVCSAKPPGSAIHTPGLWGRDRRTGAAFKSCYGRISYPVPYKMLSLKKLACLEWDLPASIL